jgi:hypothetical protein
LLFEELFKLCNRLPTTQRRLPLSLESARSVAMIDRQSIGAIDPMNIDASLEGEALRAWSLRLQTTLEYEFDMWIGEPLTPKRVGPAASIAFCKFRCAQLDAAQLEFEGTCWESSTPLTVLRKTIDRQIAELLSVAGAVKTISVWMSGLEPIITKLEMAVLRGDGPDVLASLRHILLGSIVIWRNCEKFRSDPRWLHRLAQQCAESLIDFHRQTLLPSKPNSASEHALRIPSLVQLQQVEEMCEGFYRALQRCEKFVANSQLCDTVVRLTDVACIDELLHRAKVLKEIQATDSCLSEIASLETPLFEDKKLNVQLQSMAARFHVHFERLAASIHDMFDTATAFGSHTNQCLQGIRLIHAELQRLLALAFASCRGRDQLRKLVLGLHDIAELPACKPILPHARAVTVRFARDELTDLLRLTQKLQADADCNSVSFTRSSVHLLPPLTTKLRFCHGIKVFCPFLMRTYFPASIVCSGVCRSVLSKRSTVCTGSTLLRLEILTSNH